LKHGCAAGSCEPAIWFKASIVAAALQRADLIRDRRGHVKILDVDGLKKAACECYETVNAHYAQMLVA
jgi:hypothetical protein